MSSGSMRTYEVHRTYCVLPLTVHRSSSSYWNIQSACCIPGSSKPACVLSDGMIAHHPQKDQSWLLWGSVPHGPPPGVLLCPSLFFTAKDSPAPTQRLNLNFITTFPLIPSLQDRSKGSVNKNVQKTRCPQFPALMQATGPLVSLQFNTKPWAEQTQAKEQPHRLGFPSQSIIFKPSRSDLSCSVGLALLQTVCKQRTLNCVTSCDVCICIKYTYVFCCSCYSRGEKVKTKRG